MGPLYYEPDRLWIELSCLVCVRPCLMLRVFKTNIFFYSSENIRLYGSMSLEFISRQNQICNTI